MKLVRKAQSRGLKTEAQKRKPEKRKAEKQEAPGKQRQPWSKRQVNQILPKGQRVNIQHG